MKAWEETSNLHPGQKGILWAEDRDKAKRRNRTRGSRQSRDSPNDRNRVAPGGIASLERLATAGQDGVEAEVK